jgi:hypothetical protein
MVLPKERRLDCRLLTTDYGLPTTDYFPRPLIRSVDGGTMFLARR